ncbi:bifunctional metallophosphatase/5'-nucleotidase [Cytobacillus firmus]|uniref:bifunctional metallophosphatase/5'-nucleotidase n=1 Tax=Cytobacillus firmus TaxID=1399 RepID=UPI003519DB3A
MFSDLISSEPADGKIYNGIIKEINGEKVGFFGLTTAETASISSPGKVTFEDYLEEAEKAVKTFEGMGINKIVAVTHIGYDDNPNVDNDLNLAAQVDGIDVIVGGHSHTQLNAPVVVAADETGAAKDPTVIVQAGQYNNYLGTLDVQFDETGKVTGHAGQLIKVADKAEDPEAAALLEKYSSQIEELKNTEIGAETLAALENPRISGDSTEPSVRKNETALGNLITDGMLAKAKQYDSNVIMALQNGGGIRAGIDAGPITVGEVITVLPFGNTLATMEVTGAELKEAFEISVGLYPAENGGFLHVSGAKVKFDSTKPAGERIVSIEYKNEQGTYTEIQDNQTYTIATNAFTAKGGDGYTVFAKAYQEGRVTDLGLSDWENFADHLSSLGTIKPAVEGRIIDVDSLPPVTELDFEKKYNLTDDKKKKLVVNKVSFINVEKSAEIKNGIWLKNSAVLQGDGLKNVSVRVTPKKEPIIVDFSGAEVKEVIIEKSDLVELRGAENIKKLTIK